MKFAKWRQSWDGGYDFEELEAIWFGDHVQSQYFVNGKAQTGCNWTHTHNQFADIIERNGWKPIQEVFP